ncbi:Acyl-coenzyme A oxidase [Rhynchospora pubera]|uniref:Acyl-coenzyme A oxidase n=1 Tax=Rhynchospora pubera TaxID=906938 RepID=A0AAV8GRM7_9POAL|nr:Acyl-coenzyme A oxidase [Rhynchospora pubera]
MASLFNSGADRAARRAAILANHLVQPELVTGSLLSTSNCLHYNPPELTNPASFNPIHLRQILDGHHVEACDWLFKLMEESLLFCPKRRCEGKVFVAPDYNATEEQQREMTMRRIEFLLNNGVFEGWLTDSSADATMRKFALMECTGIFDHSLWTKLGVHFNLWGSAIKFFGTRIHHDKWLRDTEKYKVLGSFSMTELGHGSNVRGVETIATYDSNTREFIINTPCESAQKYWIGSAANNEGVHAFIVQIRDSNGNTCPNIRIADCGHKIGLNGVDNGRIWFDNVCVPRENFLNLVADVLPDGQYVSSIKDPDQEMAGAARTRTPSTTNYDVHSATWADGKPALLLMCNGGH